MRDYSKTRQEILDSVRGIPYGDYMAGEEGFPIGTQFDAKALAHEQFTSLETGGLPIDSFWNGHATLDGRAYLEPKLAAVATLVNKAVQNRPDVLDRPDDVEDTYGAFAVATALRELHHQQQLGEADMHAPSTFLDGVLSVQKARLAHAYVVVSALEHASPAELEASLDRTHELMFTDEDLLGVDALIPDRGKFYNSVDSALSRMKAEDVQDDDGRLKGKLLGVTLTEGILGLIKPPAAKETIPLPPLSEGMGLDVHLNRITPSHTTVRKLSNLPLEGGSLAMSALEARLARRIDEENARLARMAEPTIPTPESRAEEAERVVWDESRFPSVKPAEEIIETEPRMYINGELNPDHITWATQQYEKKKKSWKWSPTGIPRSLPPEPAVEIPAYHPSEMPPEESLQQQLRNPEPEEYVEPQVRTIKYRDSVIRYGSSGRSPSSILKSRNR